RLLLSHRIRFLHRTEVHIGWAIDDVAPALEARAMTRAIPGSLGIVPLHDAAQVRAGGAVLVKLPMVIPVNGHLVKALAEDRTAAGRDIRDRANITSGQPVPVLPDHVQIFGGEFAGRLQGLA